MWAEECQRNCSNHQGVPWLQAGQDLALPLHSGSISLSDPFSLSAPGHWESYSRFRELELGRWRNVDEKNGLSFHISVQRNVWSGYLRRKPDAQLLSSPDEPFLLYFLVNLPPFTQKLLFHCRARSVAPGCCKRAESQWAKGWQGWITSAADRGRAGCSSRSRCCLELCLPAPLHGATLPRGNAA